MSEASKNVRSRLGGLGLVTPSANAARKATTDTDDTKSVTKLDKQALALQDRLNKIGAKISSKKDAGKATKDTGSKPKSTASVTRVSKDSKDKKKDKVDKASEEEAMESKVKKFTEETAAKAKRKDVEEKLKATASAVERERQLLKESLESSPSRNDQRSPSPARGGKRSSMVPTADVVASLGIEDDDGDGFGSVAGGRGGKRVPGNLLASLNKEKLVSHAVMREDNEGGGGKDRTRSGGGGLDTYDDIESGMGGRKKGRRGNYQVLGKEDDEGSSDHSSDSGEEMDQAQQMRINNMAFRVQQGVSMKLRSTIQNLSSSRFEDWTRQELVMLLVHRGVELRGEAAIATQTLIDMAEEAFCGEELPEKPSNFTIWELLKLSWAVAKVQDVWIEKIYRRRMEKMNGHDFLDDGDGSSEAPHSVAAMESLAAGDPSAVENETALMSVKEHDFIHSHASKMKQQEGVNGLALHSMKHSRRQAMEEHLEKARPVSMITNAMKIPWMGPDWEKARIHADYVNPRKGGKGGKPFTFYRTTTGRHCCLSGVGEQCDIFREGQTSEVGIYGSGVANYFKFLKWITGLMFTLCIITLPVVTVNYFGRAYDFTGSKDWRDISRASLGNLLPDTFLNSSDTNFDFKRESTYVNGTSIIRIEVPVCHQAEQFAAFLEGPDPDLACVLDKEGVGKYYMWIDMIIVFVVFVAYLWLKYFEDRAVKRLDSFSVFSSMYTVRI